MSFCAPALASFLLAISGATGFIVGVGVCRPIATRGVHFAMNAIIAPLPVLLAKAAALIAVFLESIGGGSEGVRRRPDGVGEASFKTVLAHLLTFESDPIENVKQDKRCRKLMSNSANRLISSRVRYKYVARDYRLETSFDWRGYFGLQARRSTRQDNSQAFFSRGVR
jgi:hypothetical protein